MFESGLRHHIVCKSSRSRAAFFVSEIQYPQCLPHFFTQPNSIYINLLMWVQLWVYPGSIMFVPHRTFERTLIMALSYVKVRAAQPEIKVYKLADGEGMVLLVHPNGSKYWSLRYRFGGNEKILALGKYPQESLADARTRRDEARKLLANGVDPSENKKAVKIEQDQEAITFEVVARDWHASNQKWSASHSARVLKSFEDNLFTTIGKRNIAELKTWDLLVPVKAVESSGRLEVAARLQQRTTAIMRFAVQSGLIDYNPAQEIAGAVATAKRQHRAALELNRITELLHRIDHYSGRPLTRLAVELTLLVFIRSSELRFARWSEVDF